MSLATPLHPDLLSIALSLRDLANTTSDIRKAKHAAAIIYKRKIMTTGVSHTSTVSSSSTHAEVDVLNNFHKLMEKRGSLSTTRKKFDLMVIRCNKQGQILNSEPCVECVDHLKSVTFIRKVYFTTNVATLLKRFNTSFEVIGCRLKRAFFEKRKFKKHSGGTVLWKDRKSCSKAVYVDGQHLLWGPCKGSGLPHYWWRWWWAGGLYGGEKGRFRKEGQYEAMGPGCRHAGAEKAWVDI